jgi:hypothetical protein
MSIEVKEKGGQRVILRGMSIGTPRIMPNQCMEVLFGYGDVAFVEECLITMEKPSQYFQHYHADIQAFPGKHERVFEQFPVGIPPDRGFEHVIELKEGSKLVITTPYRHPKRFKEEIEKAIKELLEMRHIGPSYSPFASSIVMVNKKDGNIRMCIDYRELNKNTIKTRYTIPRINEMIDDLHGSVYFLKVDQ